MSVQLLIKSNSPSDYKTSSSNWTPCILQHLRYSSGLYVHKVEWVSSFQKQRNTTVVNTYTYPLGEQWFTKRSHLATNLSKYFEQLQLVHGPQSGNY